MLEYWKKRAVNLVIGILDSLFVFLFACNSFAQADSSIDRGRHLAHDHFKGNCLACHQMPNDINAKSKANIAPTLIDIKIKYPDRNKLFDRIYDPSSINPNTIMPPYGKNEILSTQEISDIIDYLYTL